MDRLQASPCAPPIGRSSAHYRAALARLGTVTRRSSPALALVVGALLVTQCGQESVETPADTPTNTIVAYYQSPEAFAAGVIEINGERIDREWGSEFTPERPFTQVRLSAESGSGSPGPTRYMAVKAVYTDTDLYLMMQWTDPQANQLKDVFVYTGPGLRDPIIQCHEIGGVTVCDTTYRTGPQDSLQTPAWWTKVGEDDKLALAFEIEPVSSSNGTFREIGCRSLCHPGAAQPFGQADAGRVDLWYWLAGRTNPIRNLFNLADDPSEPAQGLPGYLDDWYINPTAGMVPDPGWPGYLSNDPYNRGWPEYVYRRNNDNFFDPEDPLTCRNRFGGECLANNGVPFTYLWREIPNDYVAAFNAADTLNQAVMPDMRPWVPGDMVPGYILTYPTDSRADVRGKGKHDEELHVWTLEVARRLNTGDPEHDVIFAPESGKQYTFTIALYDASVRDHWGSEPQVLVFGERPATQAK